VATVERPTASASIGREARVAPRAQAKNTAVVGWAIVGAAFIALMLYIFGAWITSDAFRHMGTGVTPVPTYQKIAAHSQEALWGAAMIAILYFVAWRPYKRNGKLSLDALIVLAMGWCWWQDPLYSYVTQSFNYSSVQLNMGGWACKIPGFASPNGCNIPQPLIWDISFYVFGMAGATIGAAALLRKWRARNPDVSTLKLLSVTFVAYCLIDFILEGTWVRLGLYHYAGGVKGWNVFQGTFYQFPLYECLAVATMMTAMTSLRFFVNDRGETIVERGASELKMGDKRRTAMRYLALVGILNVCMLVGWAGFVNVFNVHAGAWPKATQERSYLNNGLCGAGTSYACPGDAVSTPRDGESIHIDPAGNVVVPAGLSKPTVVPLSTTKK
jgi:hypothetical protein